MLKKAKKIALFSGLISSFYFTGSKYLISSDDTDLSLLSEKALVGNTLTLADGETYTYLAGNSTNITLNTNTNNNIMNIAGVNSYTISGTSGTGTIGNLNLTNTNFIVSGPNTSLRINGGTYTNSSFTITNKATLRFVGNNTNVTFNSPVSVDNSTLIFHNYSVSQNSNTATTISSINVKGASTIQLTKDNNWAAMNINNLTLQENTTLNLSVNFIDPVFNNITVANNTILNISNQNNGDDIYIKNYNTLNGATSTLNLNVRTNFQEGNTSVNVTTINANRGNISFRTDRLSVGTLNIAQNTWVEFNGADKQSNINTINNKGSVSFQQSNSNINIGTINYYSSNQLGLAGGNNVYDINTLNMLSSDWTSISTQGNSTNKISIQEMNLTGNGSIDLGRRNEWWNSQNAPTQVGYFNIGKMNLSAWYEFNISNYQYANRTVDGILNINELNLYKGNPINKNGDGYLNIDKLTLFSPIHELNIQGGELALGDVRFVSQGVPGILDAYVYNGSTLKLKGNASISDVKLYGGNLVVASGSNMVSLLTSSRSDNNRITVNGGYIFIVNTDLYRNTRFDIGNGSLRVYDVSLYNNANATFNIVNGGVLELNNTQKNNNGNIIVNVNNGGIFKPKYTENPNLTLDDDTDVVEKPYIKINELNVAQGGTLEINNMLLEVSRYNNQGNTIFNINAKVAKKQDIKIGTLENGLIIDDRFTVNNSNFQVNFKVSNSSQIKRDEMRYIEVVYGKQGVDMTGINTSNFTSPLATYTFAITNPELINGSNGDASLIIGLQRIRTNVEVLNYLIETENFPVNDKEMMLAGYIDELIAKGDNNASVDKILSTLDGLINYPDIFEFLKAVKTITPINNEMYNMMMHGNSVFMRDLYQKSKLEGKKEGLDIWSGVSSNIGSVSDRRNGNNARNDGLGIIAGGTYNYNDNHLSLGIGVYSTKIDSINEKKELSYYDGNSIGFSGVIDYTRTLSLLEDNDTYGSIYVMYSAGDTNTTRYDYVRNGTESKVGLTELMGGVEIGKTITTRSGNIKPKIYYSYSVIDNTGYSDSGEGILFSVPSSQATVSEYGAGVDLSKEVPLNKTHSIVYQFGLGAGYANVYNEKTELTIIDINKGWEEDASDYSGVVRNIEFGLGYKFKKTTSANFSYKNHSSSSNYSNKIITFVVKHNL
jgi:hypothetical protein